MKRFPAGLMYIFVGGVCAAALLGVGSAYAIPTNDPFVRPTEMAIEVQRYNASLQQQMEDANRAIEEKVSGYSTSISDTISQGAGAVRDGYNSATSYTDQKIGEAGDYVMDKASAVGKSISDMFTSDTPGDGFSISKMFKSIKDGLAEYGHYLTPVFLLAQGDFFGSIKSIKDEFFTGSKDKDVLSSYDVTDVQTNLKKFIQEATRTMIVDATQVMNGTAQYQKVQEGASKAAKPTNLREDIQNSTETALSMNVMTNVLLSMDITDLSIQSAMIYNSINILSASSFLMGSSSIMPGL